MLRLCAPCNTSACDVVSQLTVRNLKVQIKGGEGRRTCKGLTWRGSKDSAAASGSLEPAIAAPVILLLLQLSYLFHAPVQLLQRHSASFGTQACGAGQVYSSEPAAV